MKKVSVIIVTYNSERHIYECLESLFRFNDIGDDLEVIVVDNCSREYEQMADTLTAKYGERVTIVQNTKNGGYGQGNNVGIKITSAPVIMIMNPDVRLCEPVFDRAYNTFEGNKNVVMYSLTQKNGEGKIGRSTAWSSRVHPYISEPLRYLMGKFNLYWQKYMYFSGACFFVRKSSFEQIGLFDENIFMYNEEDDIHGRLIKQKGAKIIYDRNHYYIHLHTSVSDYKAESYDWLKRDLDSLIYLNERDGIERGKTISWAIKRTNVSVWSEQFKKLFGRGKEERISYFKGWREIQKEILKQQS
jgi:GT2 family glycosyltransferase